MIVASDYLLVRSPAPEIEWMWHREVSLVDSHRTRN